MCWSSYHSDIVIEELQTIWSNLLSSAIHWVWILSYSWDLHSKEEDYSLIPYSLFETVYQQYDLSEIKENSLIKHLDNWFYQAQKRY